MRNGCKFLVTSINFFETNVVFYSIFKRKLKNQPLSGERTCNGMFRSLIEGKFYFIPKLLEGGI